MLGHLSYVSNLRFSFSDHNTHTRSNSDFNAEEDIQVIFPTLLHSSCFKEQLQKEHAKE